MQAVESFWNLSRYGFNSFEELIRPLGRSFSISLASNRFPLQLSFIFDSLSFPSSSAFLFEVSLWFSPNRSWTESAHACVCCERRSSPLATIVRRKEWHFKYSVIPPDLLKSTRLRMNVAKAVKLTAGVWPPNNLNTQTLQRDSPQIYFGEFREMPTRFFSHCFINFYGSFWCSPASLMLKQPQSILFVDPTPCEWNLTAAGTPPATTQDPLTACITARLC